MEIKSIPYEASHPMTTLPVVFEIYICDDETGSFNQIAGPFEVLDTAKATLIAMHSHPDFEGRKIFVARVARRGILANFDYREIKRDPRK